MKGKKVFTSQEIKRIEELIEEKLKSPSNKQKRVRDRIRDIGFYWEDYHPKGEKPKVEYNVENFRELIEEGKITVKDDGLNKSGIIQRLKKIIMTFFKRR